VLGDDAVGDALARTVKDRLLGGRSIAVSHLTLDAPPKLCHVLYVSGVTATQAARVVAGLGDAPVLTLSDVDGFTARGGIAQFFFESGRLRFSVHLASVKRARLQISSRLLALARPQ
jgi:hypothetical protein